MIHDLQSLKKHIADKTGAFPDWPVCLSAPTAMLVGEGGDILGMASVNLALSNRHKQAGDVARQVLEPMSDCGNDPLMGSTAGVAYVVFSDGSVVTVEVLAETRVKYTVFPMNVGG